MSKRGVPVFNAPGANANAVKELVLASLFLAARNIPAVAGFRAQARRRRQGDDEAVEAGKKKFVGFELPGRTLGVIGLGAIGVKVANAALELGMTVWGFDPAMTVQPTPGSSISGVRQALSVDDLLAKSQFVSVHVPLLDATRKLINADRLKLMKKQGVDAELRARCDRRRASRCRRAGRRHAACLRLRLSRECAQGHSEGHRDPAPGRLDRRS